MNKKSGLADSPFFNSPPEAENTPPPSQDETLVSGNQTVDTPLPENADDPQTPQAYEEENQDQKRTIVRTDERTIVRTDVRTLSKPKRQKIRHAFDIYDDQLRDLQLLQFEAVQRGKKKPKLGKMVQEAIDTYIKKNSPRSRG